MMPIGSVVLFALLVVGSYATDYCSKTLCQGAPHIGCNNPNKFAATCNSPSLPNFDDKLKNFVLSIHNDYRNKLASGATKFASAVRMPLLKWNEELAKLAQYNVQQCAMKHDQCRSTDEFPYAGQNLGYYATTATLTYSVVVDFVKKIQDSWYAESKDAQQAWLDKYTSNTGGKVIGHFTAMIQDHTTHIGCAVLQYKILSGSTTFNSVLLACNYGYTNMLNYPVYTKGKSGSQCKTGMDTTYTSLCSSSEVVSPTPF